MLYTHLVIISAFERLKILNAIDSDSENMDFSSFLFRNDNKISNSYNVYFIKINDIIDDMLKQQISNLWLWITL